MEKNYGRMSDLEASRTFADYYIIMANLERKPFSGNFSGDVIFISEDRDEAAKFGGSIKESTAFLWGVNTREMGRERIGDVNLCI
ncbi:MAG: hypothetical protein LBE35_04535 [Clostridiales bacterium]|jgi:hypothetical protein|nr:hypothetical protein [Clostridiales bacterium]